MGHIINKLVGYYQQGSYLYKPTSGIKYPFKHSWTSSRLQEQASENVDHTHTSQNLVSGVMVISLLTELLIGNENHSLTLHASVVGYGKSSHKYIFDKDLTIHMEHVQC